MSKFLTITAPGVKFDNKPSRQSRPCRKCRTLTTGRDGRTVICMQCTMKFIGAKVHQLGTLTRK